MAEVKWIKILTNIFDDEKILLIESLPEADAIIVIWFKLLCLAGKQNNSGVFMMSEKIPYTDEMLATIFRRKLTTVRLALDTFESFGMIEVINNVITIPNWSKHQSLDKLEKRRKYMKEYMQEYREEQKKITEGKPRNDNDNSKVNSKVNVNTLDREVDIDIEEDIDNNNNNIDFEKIKNYWNKHSKLKEIVAITEKRKGHLNARIKEHGIEAVFKVIDNTGESVFMRGENNRGWIATFDWVIKPNNFIKVLEGTYLKRKNKEKSSHDFYNIGGKNGSSKKYGDGSMYPDER